MEKFIRIEYDEAETLEETAKRLRKEAREIEKQAKANRKAQKAEAEVARQIQADIELAKETLREIAGNIGETAYDRESAAHTLLAAHGVLAERER